MAARQGLISIAVSVVVWSDRRMLLVREAKADVRGQWNLPGGRLEPGESVLAAAIREVREESRLAITPTGLLGLWSGPAWMRVVYTAAVTPEQAARATAGDEIMEIVWRTPDEAMALGPEALHHLMDEILERVLDGPPYPIDVVREAR